MSYFDNVFHPYGWIPSNIKIGYHTPHASHKFIQTLLSLQRDILWRFWNWNFESTIKSTLFNENYKDLAFSPSKFGKCVWKTIDHVLITISSLHDDVIADLFLTDSDNVK